MGVGSVLMIAPMSEAWLAKEGARSQQRNVKFLQERAAHGEGTRSKTLRCRFLVGPTELHGSGGTLRSVRVQHMSLVADADGTNPVQVVPRPDVPGGWMWSFAPDGRSLMGVTRISYGEDRVVLVPVDPGASATILDIRLPGSSEFTPTRVNSSFWCPYDPKKNSLSLTIGPPSWAVYS